jgi:monoamine oxidase
VRYTVPQAIVASTLGYRKRSRLPRAGLGAASAVWPPTLAPQIAPRPSRTSLLLSDDQSQSASRLAAADGTGGWRFQFPNTADFNFNYWTLLAKARQTAIAKPPADVDRIRIAIVGAGVAGLTAARELFRSGYKNIDIYEATERIGGRTLSETSPLPGDLTPFEMGAMRVPFFWPSKNKPSDGRWGPGSSNAVIDYYCREFGIKTDLFPNPGTEGVTTGVYVNRGYGPRMSDDEYDPPDDPNSLKQLIRWRWFDSAGASHRRRGSGAGWEWKTGDPDLDEIHSRWATFKKTFQGVCEDAYSDEAEWRKLWLEIVEEYGRLSFRQFALKKVGNGQRGQLGGLGMKPWQARVFAVVGMGDGGWGAFYDVSCLYVLRVCMFGISDNLQLIKGVMGDDGTPARSFGAIPLDSLGHELVPPRFLGAQSIAECLFYKPAITWTGEKASLYDAVRDAKSDLTGVRLYLRTPVRRIRRIQDDPPRLTLTTDKSGDLADERIYERVIVTAMPWSLDVEGSFERFLPSQLRWVTRDAMKSSHFITSCKVFFPLKKLYWEGEEAVIPQVIVTDTFLQGAYGIAVSRGDPASERGYRGVLLASYTWEDDATKLIADDDHKLAQRCLDALDDMMRRCGLPNISQYVINSPKVHHWSRSPSYRGCARLYRPNMSQLDYALLTYNRKYGMKSHLYLAGEAYSVEGGWIEPALRSALDAVIHLVKHTNGTFRDPFDFDYADYPSHTELPKFIDVEPDSRSALTQ